MYKYRDLRSGAQSTYLNETVEDLAGHDGLLSKGAVARAGVVARRRGRVDGGGGELGCLSSEHGRDKRDQDGERQGEHRWVGGRHLTVNQRGPADYKGPKDPFRLCGSGSYD
jgi:hypothetical protein